LDLPRLRLHLYLLDSFPFPREYRVSLFAGAMDSATTARLVWLGG
jgi:hypothetical protein